MSRPPLTLSKAGKELHEAKEAKVIKPRPDIAAPSVPGHETDLGITPTSRRGLARRFTVQAVYQWIVNETAAEALLKQFREQDEGIGRADPEYFAELLRGIVAEAPTLTQAFVPFLDRPLAQLDPVETAVLLMGSYELLHKPEVPYRVVVNEAVNLAKIFGAEDGHKFVNGVLDKLARTARSIEVDNHL